MSAPASDGRANAEAEKLLGEIVGARVELVGGMRSRRKRFAVDLDAERLDARLRDAFGP